MDKEQTINAIKERILKEYEKHKDFDWAEIAARKIYGTHIYLNSDQAKQEWEERVNKDTWEQGLPKVYMNEYGDIVEHWSDGTINILKRNV